MKKKVSKIVLTYVLSLSILTACGSQEAQPSQDIVEKKEAEYTEEQGEVSQSTETLSGYEDIFTGRDLEQVADIEAAVYVNLSDGGSAIDGRGAVAEGNVITFSEEGVYVISGNLSDGQLIIDADKEDKIQLVLEGVSVTNDTSAALYVKQADKVFVTTGAGTDNSLCTTGEFEDIDVNDIDGAVFSKEDIIFNGKGALDIICSADHGIVGKDDIKITGGKITVDADGDGLQANGGIYIAEGIINVLNSSEGLEAQNISIWGGNITIIAEDDGINGAGGNDESGLTSFGGNNPFAADLACNVAIHGGIVKINADGDGLDSNGNLIINGGEVYVDGPTNGGNGAIDYSGSGIINGGILVATGASQMAENMSHGSSQCVMMVTFSNQMSEGEIVVRDDSGNVILSYTPEKCFNNAVISHPDFEVGKTYTVSVGETLVEVTFESVIFGQGMMNGGPAGQGGFDGGKGQDGADIHRGGMQPPEGFEPPEGMDVLPPPPKI